MLRLGMFLFLFTIVCSGSDKWVVITTINKPTEAVKIFAKLKDWRVVVVGDKKTPKNWYCKGCDYLSFDDQKKLGFEITKYLPSNHYSRKNIGYLYAISKGAKIIYDTDDDNYIDSGKIKHLPQSSSVNVCSSNKQFYNIYRYFGCDDSWPRGYPLRYVLEGDVLVADKEEVDIPIQQGLVDDDPDVDAIFRLTRGKKVFFDRSKKPLCLQSGVYCPFNSQNTVFYKKAFWGLLIPITTSFRVTDIWRGYWVQRILWELGSRLCFLSPAVTQIRNDHDLMNDFNSELDLYCKTEEYIDLLSRWHFPAGSLANAIEDLFQIMIKNNMYKAGEIDLLRAWLKDLSKLNII